MRLNLIPTKLGRFVNANQTLEMHRIPPLSRTMPAIKRIINLIKCHFFLMHNIKSVFQCAHIDSYICKHLVKCLCFQMIIYICSRFHLANANANAIELNVENIKQNRMKRMDNNCLISFIKWPFAITFDNQLFICIWNVAAFFLSPISISRNGKLWIIF